jgi:HEPN domain-containing protein
MPPEYAPGSAEDWLSRARGKLLLARQPLPEGGYWEDLAFMAQQAAELAIKAVYQHGGWRFPFIHDIRYLLDGLEKRGITVPEQVREAERLTIFATQMRYPGMRNHMAETDHATMLSIAGAVVAWADSILAS